MQRNRKKFSIMNKYFSLLFKVSAVMLMSILICFSIGLYIDQTLDTSGISIIVFTFLGVFIGFYFVFKLINSVLK